MERVDWRQVGIFYALACAISGVFALALFLSGASGNGLVKIALAVPYMFGPALAAWLTARRFNARGTVGASLGLPSDPQPPAGRPRLFFNRFWVVGWLLPAVLVLAITGVSLLLPHLSYDAGMTGLLEKIRGMVPPEEFEKAREKLTSLPVHPFWLGLPQGLLAGLSINAIAAFGEELGWRGFLYRHLSPLGFWRASLATGVLWGIWHAPLILQGHNYPEHPVLGVLWMVIFCVLLSPLFHWVRQRSQTVLSAALMHGSINGLFALPPLLVAGGNDLTSGATGLPGFIVLAAATGILAVAVRPGQAGPR